MKSSPEEKISFWNQPFIKSLLEGMGQTLGIGLLLVIPVLAFFYLPKPQGSLISEVTSVGVGATVAAVLAAVVEAPLIVAIGVGIVIWWLTTQLLF